MGKRRSRRSFAVTRLKETTVSTIVIGVDTTERSEDAIVFGHRLAEASGASVIVACAFPYSDIPSRAANLSYRHALAEEATRTALEKRAGLEGFPDDRVRIRVIANPSAPHALHDLAAAEHASLVVVGSTHTGSAGRVLPGSTGERLLHGSPCSVAVVPKEYRKWSLPIRRIGVAYNATEEAKAAVRAAADLALALGAELEIIGIVSAESFGTPALMGGPSEVKLREDIERHVQESLEEIVATVPAGVEAKSVLLTGSPAEMLAGYSAKLDLLVTGSRGYGPLRSVLVGGVSGRLTRSAHCPVIIVPRGIEEPLGRLFDGTTAAAM
jgi:nucleotide-binding universal stress UspA family protein